MAQPIAKFKAGEVTAALWENSVVLNGKQVSMQKATVERRYKDRDGPKGHSESGFFQSWHSDADIGRGVMLLPAAEVKCPGCEGLLLWCHIRYIKEMALRLHRSLF